MNGDLISKAALLKKAVNFTEYDEGGWDMRVLVIRAQDVEEAPAVDAEPVRHAHWKKDARGITRCTSCKGRLPYTEDMETYLGDIYQQEIDETEYCPHCGAKMDMEE